MIISDVKEHFSLRISAEQQQKMNKHRGGDEGVSCQISVVDFEQIYFVLILNYFFFRLCINWNFRIRMMMMMIMMKQLISSK
jgi:hypothetical protein